MADEMDVERPDPSMSVFISLIDNAVGDMAATSVDVNDSVGCVLQNKDPKFALDAYTKLGHLIERLSASARDYKPASLMILLERLRFVTVACVILNDTGSEVEKVFPGLTGMSAPAKKNAFQPSSNLAIKECVDLLLQAGYAERGAGDVIKFALVPWSWKNVDA